MQTSQLFSNETCCIDNQVNANQSLADTLSTTEAPNAAHECNHRFVNWGPLAYCTECGLEGVYLGKV